MDGWIWMDLDGWMLLVVKIHSSITHIFDFLDHHHCLSLMKCNLVFFQIIC